MIWGAIAQMAIGAAGGYMSGRSQRQAASYNARLLEQQAEQTRLAAETEAEMGVDRARRLSASQRVAFAKSGASPSSGTPLLVMAEQAGDMQRDILEQRRSRLLEEQSLRSQAAMTHWGGRMASRSALISGIAGGAQQSGIGTILGNKGGGSNFGGPSRSNVKFAYGGK